MGVRFPRDMFFGCRGVVRFWKRTGKRREDSLAISFQATALGVRDVAVVAGAAGFAAVDGGGAGEFVGYVLVDAALVCCGWCRGFVLAVLVLRDNWDEELDRMRARRPCVRF